MPGEWADQNAGLGIVATMATTSGEEVRLLIVEDVPQVAQYIRNLLASQSGIKLVDVVSDGGKALHQIAQLRPDIVIVDALLQGRTKGMALVAQIHAQSPGLPVIVLTVPQQPVQVAPSMGIHAVLSMPFSAYDVLSKIQAVRASQGNGGDGASRIVCVFAPKGGVGKTTIAFNLAVAVGQQETRTVSIDGSLQFGDLRALLKVPADAPSILGCRRIASRNRICRTSCGATPRASTFSSRPRESRWRRWSPRATSRRCSRCFAGCTRSS